MCDTLRRCWEQSGKYNEKGTDKAINTYVVDEGLCWAIKREPIAKNSFCIMRGVIEGMGGSR